MNDTNAAALGEYNSGAVYTDSFMCITLGTGIGAGIVLNGSLYEGQNYYAGEIGHLVMNLRVRSVPVEKSVVWKRYHQEQALLSALSTFHKMRAQLILRMIRYQDYRIYSLEIL